VEGPFEDGRRSWFDCVHSSKRDEMRSDMARRDETRLEVTCHDEMSRRCHWSVSSFERESPCIQPKRSEVDCGDVEMEARLKGRVVAVVAMIEMGRFAPERADGNDRSEQSTG
jgi:hypothetical protein